MESLEIPVDEAWEINANDLVLGETLGEGAFGIVVKAQAVSLPTKPNAVSTVAVKMLKGIIRFQLKIKFQSLIKVIEVSYVRKPFQQFFGENDNRKGRLELQNV